MNKKNPRVLYVGDKDSLHHQRFIKLLNSNFETRFVFTQSHIPATIHLYAPHLVICAPLQEPLQFALSYYSVPILGISWAQEINEPRRIYETDSEFLLALKKLSGLIVDSQYHVNIVQNLLELNIPIKIVPFNVAPLPINPLPKFADMRLPTIISARSFEPLYRNDLILQSASSLATEETFQLMMIGGGSQLESMKKVYSQTYLENRLSFTGPVSNERLLNLMSESHFYVSAARSDGISVTLLEAMHLGLICLISDFPTNKEVISHGYNGFLFNNGDSDSFRTELKSMLNLNSAQLTSISINARSTVQNKFSWRNSSSTFLRFINTFLA